jgi:hypothetical protein
MPDPSQDINGPKLAADLKAVLAKNIEANLQLLTRVSGMVRETARNLGDPASKPQQPGELINRMVQLNLSYFTLLTKHGLAFADELTTITERALGIRPGAPPPAPTAAPSSPGASTNVPRIEINLNAHVGETATASFLVENNQEQTLKVSFEASQIISRGGRPIGSPSVWFEPSHLNIEPGMQAAVKALIDISPEFKAGEIYLLRVRLVGFQQKEVWIGIHVLPPTPKTERAAPRPKKRKRPTKTR